MTDDLVKRLRAETDRATVNPDGLEEADYIEKLIKSRTNLRIIGKEISERVVSLIAVLNSSAMGGQTWSTRPMTTCHIKMPPTTQKTLPRRKG